MTPQELLNLVANEMASGLGISGVEVAQGWDAYCIVTASASVFGMLSTVKVDLVLHGPAGSLRYSWEAHTGEALTIAIPSIRAAVFDSTTACGTLAALERIAAAWSQ